MAEKEAQRLIVNPPYCTERFERNVVDSDLVLADTNPELIAVPTDVLWQPIRGEEQIEGRTPDDFLKKDGSVLGKVKGSVSFSKTLWPLFGTISKLAD